MNSIKQDQLAAVIGPLFDQVLMPIAQRMRDVGVMPFPLQPDTSWLSYYVRRKRSLMSREDFIGASCMDSAGLAQCLAAHWQALGRQELAAQVGQFVAAAGAAQALLAEDTLSPELSPYVYAMF
ncbi:MAG: hypothetical protein V4508_06935 [Pseudomonadota bacterium]